MTEMPVPYERAMRDILSAHLKAAGPARIAELAGEAELTDTELDVLLRRELQSRYPAQTAFVDDAWFENNVPISSCYFAHTDFRYHSVPHGERMADYLETVRDLIRGDSFPHADEIRSAPVDGCPPPLAYEHGDGEFRITDGQLRVIRRWYHGCSNVRIYVYRGNKNL